MVKGLAHVALYTAMFEETIKFYEDVFGAENLGCFETDKRACRLAGRFAYTVKNSNREEILHYSTFSFFVRKSFRG